MATGAGIMLAAIFAATAPLAAETASEKAALRLEAADSLTINYFAKVFLLPSEDAPLMGLAEDGLRLAVFRRKEGWAQVGFRRATGWIRTAPPPQGNIPVTVGFPIADGKGSPNSAMGGSETALASALARASVVRLPRRLGIALALGLAGSACALMAAMLASRRGRRKTRRPGPPVPAGRRALLLAPRQKVIESHLPGVFIPLGQALRDLGFAVEHSDTLARCAMRFRKGDVPAVLGLDVRLGRRATAGALDLCRRAGRAPVMIFLYNSDDPEAIRPPADLPQVHYLNGRFSSRHVMELLAPLYHARPAAEGDEAVPAVPCSLEGRIETAGLSDILQFLEVGRRSGMLSIEDGPPAGVLNFANGIITFAQTRTAEGADAVLEILSLVQGGFRFYLDKRIDQCNCRLSAFEVALRWAHRHDETVKMAQGREYAWAHGPVSA
ncbi:MAG: DUF4388 domain-containing protein [Fibrobacteres bacterium]|nr:DUF4388 domain-containing protein [Fibrobacterota bacterium]